MIRDSGLKELYKRIKTSLYFRICGKVIQLFGVHLRKVHEREILGVKEANLRIKSLIQSNLPLMISRFGTTEGKFLLEANSKFNEHKLEKVATDLWQLSGVYPIDEQSLDYFARVYRENANQIDLLGVRSAPEEFTYWEMEKRLAEEFCKEAILFDIEGLFPLNSPNPWTLALESRKVLVVHPFIESMKIQYSKRKELFGDHPILPHFEPIWLKAPQTLGFEDVDSKNRSWASSLSQLLHEIEVLDFQIALIGCGAYGLPIASRIKALGKQAIHIGGVLQIIFGIKGQRWDKELQGIIPPINYSNWIWPSPDETPKNAGNVEGGAYWSPEFFY